MRSDYSDVSLIIPFKIDSLERERNLERCKNHFSKFEGIVLIDSFLDAQSKEPFHKTSLINKALYNEVETPYFGILDCDMLCSPVQFTDAIDALRTGFVDFVYPYDGTFVDVPQELVEGFLAGTLPKPHDFNVLNAHSFGGLIVGKTSVYREAGGENQNFISWGPEDIERHERLMELGFKVGRIPGAIFHMGHPRGKDSSEENPFFEANNQEFKRIMGLRGADLWTEVRSWTRPPGKEFR
jgi:hypothetical protein